MAREDLHFRLRIPAYLKERVEKSATEHKRSMTAEIVSVLEEKFGTEDEQITTRKSVSTAFRVDELIELLNIVRDDVERLKISDEK